MAMEERSNDRPSTLTCALVALDHTNVSYIVCSTCERPLPQNSFSSCRYCHNSGPKRLFRILISIASDTEVFVVICFDRAAKVLFGCSADQFFDFAKIHPFAAETAGEILAGEMFRMTLSKPKNGNAQHLRVASVVPLRTGFRPAIETLKELYGSMASIIHDTFKSIVASVM